jgi:hypothetical protein
MAKNMNSFLAVLLLFPRLQNAWQLAALYQSVGELGQRRHYSDWLRVDPFGVQSREEQEIFLYSNPASYSTGKGNIKGLPQQAEVAQGVPSRLRPRIFLTFGTTRVAGRQPYAPAAFTLREIPGTHF